MTRWLNRGVISLCLALSLAGRSAHGQGVTWVRGFAPQAANVPAGVTWQQSTQFQQAEFNDSPPARAVRFQAPGVAVVPQGLLGDPEAKTPLTDSQPAVATFDATLRAARLGAPLALPDLPAEPDDALVPVQYVPPLSRREGTDDFAEAGLLPTTIQLTLPGPHRLFRLDSEAAVQERIRQEARQTRTPTMVEFPEPLRFEPRERIMIPRRWPLTKELIEPCYVNHGRLFFEQVNSDRYGWSMGIAQPVVSALHFYADVVTLPYHLAQEPCRFGDTSAGKCLPGDPVALYHYPPQYSLSGLSAEAAAVALLFCVFP